MNKIFSLIIAAFLSFFHLNNTSDLNSPTPVLTPPPKTITLPPMVGGQCSYDNYYGKCQITKIDIIDESSISINFKFIPDSILSLLPLKIKHNRVSVEKILADEHQTSADYLSTKCLKDIYPVKKSDLDNCNIKESLTLNCHLRLITEGSCAPLDFDFSD